LTLHMKKVTTPGTVAVPDDKAFSGSSRKCAIEFTIPILTNPEALRCGVQLRAKNLKKPA
jgi:hypothetical protein